MSIKNEAAPEAQATEQDLKITRAYQIAAEHARNQPHKTIPVQVWADIDEGVAEIVKYLNTLPGVRTQACCQGTEYGPHPYPAYIMAEWNTEIDERLQKEFEVEYLGKFWGYLRPRPRGESAEAHPPQHVARVIPADAQEVLADPKATPEQIKEAFAKEMTEIVTGIKPVAASVPVGDPARNAAYEYCAWLIDHDDDPTYLAEIIRRHMGTQTGNMNIGLHESAQVGTQAPKEKP